MAIAAPVIAGVLVLTLLSASAEDRYEASATVAVPQAISSDLNQSALRTVLGDFANAYTSIAAAEDVADQVGGSARAISNNASAVPAGEGSEVVVRLEGADRVALEDQLKLLTETALTQLAEEEVEEAASVRRAAERQLANAIEGLAVIEVEAGTTDLLNEYRQRSAEVQQLRTEIAREFQNPSLQGALQEVLDEKRAEADELSILVTQWELRRNQANEASAARDQAERDEFRAESKLERVGTDASDLRVQVEPTSSVTDAGVPVIAAMAIALALVVVFAIMSTRRELDEELREADGGEGESGDDGDVPDEHARADGHELSDDEELDDDVELVDEDGLVDEDELAVEDATEDELAARKSRLRSKGRSHWSTK